MFTWIIENQAKILKVEGWRFTVENLFWNDVLKGQSISHDGACMTIEAFSDHEYTFFAMEETFNKTNFGAKKEGDFFNVERCLQIGDRLDGHFVTGHIDTVWVVNRVIEKQDGSWVVFIDYDAEFHKNIIPKGSVAINGTSLTVVDDIPWQLSVSLIPFTWELTNLGKLKVGDGVNLEFDMFGKYAQKLQNKQ